MINVIVSGIEGKKVAINMWLAAAIMLLSPVLTGLCNHWFYQLVMIDGLHARTAIQAAVYKKVLNINPSANEEISDTITNLQAVDCRSIEMVYWMWIYVWASPVQVIAIIVLLYLQLGWPIFIGVFLLLIGIPIQKMIMKKLQSYGKDVSKASDERIKLITEAIHGIEVIKLQAWEYLFDKRVNEKRLLELKERKSIAILTALNSAVTKCAPILCTLITFIVYGIVSDNELTSSKAFTTLALFNVLRQPLMVLPMLIGMIARGKVAAKRLADFFYTDEIDSYIQYGNDSKQMINIDQSLTFTWYSSSKNDDNNKKEEQEEEIKEIKEIKKDDEVKKDKFQLHIDNFQLNRGELTVLCGKVGSGKSSFLSAILGEMKLLNHQKSAVHINGSIAYCNQDPWIQNATLRNNILFGNEYNEELYLKILKICALEEDIKSLPGGDLTEIGERGINLSGGQKARVSLARACYASHDIIILDDILSAVDVHVASILVNQCIINYMIKEQNKAVLLATHQSVSFTKADHFIILEDGYIKYNGLYHDISTSENQDEIDLLASVMVSKAHQIANAKQEIKQEEIEIKMTNNDPSKKEEEAVEAAEQTATTSSSEQQQEKEQEEEKVGKLTKEEKTEEGAVKTDVYKAYIKKIGSKFTIIIISLVIAMNVQEVLTNWWLGQWSKESLKANNDHSLSYYLSIYFCFGIFSCIFILFYEISSAIGGLNAAADIHQSMFHSLLKAPMSFFDITPSGQLLNRFTSDMEAIDNSLISTLSGALSLIFLMFSVLITILSILPWMILSLIPLFYLYSWIQNIYRDTARELKRFDSKSQSPIYNYFSETINGLSTIRAFNKQQMLINETELRINYNTRFWTKNNFVNRWLGLRLDWIGAFLLGTAAFATVLIEKVNILNYRPSSALIGLVLSYTATLCGLLNWGVRRFSETEMGMIAVERTKTLINCIKEVEVNETKEIIPSAEWPINGHISINNLTIKYRENLPNVLHNLTFQIPAGCKIGICGRTGSGKTTFVKSLFRLIPISNGMISIDNLDINQISLYNLRSKITMIPQDPILFTGSLRYSIDPANKYTDDEIWHILEIVEMKSYFHNLSDVINSENLSAGQTIIMYG